MVVSGRIWAWEARRGRIEERRTDCERADSDHLVRC